MSSSEAVFSSSAPTGLKGKIASLEEFIQTQNEEIASQRQEIEQLRNAKSLIEQHYQQQLLELKKVISGDLARVQEEVKKHFTQQKAENSRVTQQVGVLKGEKTALQQQIIGLQRRIAELEEQIGQD
jgi:chromosome segregation ATPase